MLVKGGRGKVGVKKHKVPCADRLHTPQTLPTPPLLHVLQRLHTNVRTALPDFDHHHPVSAGFWHQDCCQEQEQGQGQEEVIGLHAIWMLRLYHYSCARSKHALFSGPLFHSVYSDADTLACWNCCVQPISIGALILLSCEKISLVFYEALFNSATFFVHSGQENETIIIRDLACNRDLEVFWQQQQNRSLYRHL